MITVEVTLGSIMTSDEDSSTVKYSSDSTTSSSRMEMSRQAVLSLAVNSRG